MLQKNDLVLLLSEMSDKGDKLADKYLSEVFTSTSIPIEILRYINNYRPLQVTQFYEGLRKSYNNKKSKLYKNIVRDEIDVDETIATLHSFALQLFLYSKKLTDEEKVMFYKHVRAEEITRVLNNYYKDYDVNSVLKMLRLIKADLIAFESVTGRR